MELTGQLNKTPVKIFALKQHQLPGADTGFVRGGQYFLGTKKFIIRNKKSRRSRKFFFGLKDSKRVKIND